MTSSISDTTASPAPFSPFSTHSGGSDLATSDESPDLGAFTTVFRALNELQPRTFAFPLPNIPATTPTTTISNLSPTEYDSDIHRGSTVWNHQPIASYLSISSRDNALSQSKASPPPPSDPVSSSDTEGDFILEEESDMPSLNQPSLGYLDEALEFLAAERAKLTSQRDSTWRGNSSPSDSAWRHPAPQRRKRRRKKTKSVVREILSRETPGDGSRTETIETVVDQELEEEDSSSSPEISSSSPAHFKSTPATPPLQKRERKVKRTAALDANHKLSHSKSTPLLRNVSISLDPRVVRLRTLAIKLRFLFPEDADTLSAVLSNDSFQSSAPDLIDPRGPSPIPGQPITHVFVDYSNILIGFLTYLRQHPHHLTPNTARHMSHAALALILERGRPTARRVLAASSPLYQPIDTAEQLGYDTHVYARVPDTGDGADRQRRSGDDWKGKGHRRAHSRKQSTGNGTTSTESEPGPGAHNHTNTNANTSANANTGSPRVRVRYREQGVDELLQLKLHQAIAVDAPPAGSTIVLATGDGNVGQFNEEGFLGCARTALKRGWHVELYAWEGGLSRAWVREFGDGAPGSAWAGRFRIVPMDAFGADLLEA